MTFAHNSWCVSHTLQEDYLPFPFQRHKFLPPLPSSSAAPQRAADFPAQENGKVWGLVHFSANTHYLPGKTLAENMDLSPLCVPLCVLSPVSPPALLAARP